MSLGTGVGLLGAHEASWVSAKLCVSVTFHQPTSQLRLSTGCTWTSLEAPHQGSRPQVRSAGECPPGSRDMVMGRRAGLARGHAWCIQPLAQEGCKRGAGKGAPDKGENESLLQIWRALGLRLWPPSVPWRDPPLDQACAHQGSCALTGCGATSVGGLSLVTSILFLL